MRRFNVFYKMAPGTRDAFLKDLLENKIYDCAYLVKGYNYDSVLKADKVTEFEKNTAKSRYLSVSMEKLVKEMLANRAAIAIVGIIKPELPFRISIVTDHPFNTGRIIKP